VVEEDVRRCCREPDEELRLVDLPFRDLSCLLE